MAKLNQTMKVGFHAEAPVGVDLGYWTNLIAEIADTWMEVKDTAMRVWDTVTACWIIILQIWNLLLQIVQLVTAVIPFVRTVVKRVIDIFRAQPALAAKAK